MSNFQEKTDLIWTIADLLRGDYKPREYVDVILPMTVFRRLDQAIENTREVVWSKHKEYQGKLENLDGVLQTAAESLVYNTSAYNWEKLLQAPDDLSQNLIHYLNGFSPEVQDIIDKFDFRRQVGRLQTASQPKDQREFDSSHGLLYLIVKEFGKIDLHPEKVDNREMGLIFENLIRRFSEQYNETAGEHFTPREVIELMVQLLFSEYRGDLDDPNAIIKVYDPACGTGGMLTEAKKFIELQNGGKTPRVMLFGQELNPTAYAVAKSDILLKGEDPERIVYGNSFSEDGYSDKSKYRFEIMMSNPPFGVSWKKVEWVIKREHKNKGYDGRFGAGLPRINDGALLFLQHMLSKMKEEDPGSRIAIIFNGSPLFTGDAGSGESEIRRWIIENDWLEGIVALPDQMFYNTGINTYIWILTNKKDSSRKGKIQLIDASSGRFYGPQKPKSLGDKRHIINAEQITEIKDIYENFSEGEYCRIYDNIFFGFRKVRVDRPLRLNLQASEERIERIKEETGFQNLAKSRKRDEKAKALEESAGRKLQQQILSMLSGMPDTLFKDRKDFKKALRKQVQNFNKSLNEDEQIKLTASVVNAIVSALSEKDETAEPCFVKDKENQGFEPDPDLRDYENVPLTWEDYPKPLSEGSGVDDFDPIGETVQAYFEKEVLPFVPDAYIDVDYKDEKDNRVGRIGYEINFNRYFYKYNPPRDLDVIQKEIEVLEKEIIELLGEVTD